LPTCFGSCLFETTMTTTARRRAPAMPRSHNSDSEGEKKNQRCLAAQLRRRRYVSRLKGKRKATSMLLLMCCTDCMVRCDVFYELCVRAAFSPFFASMNCVRVPLNPRTIDAFPFFEGCSLPLFLDVGTIQIYSRRPCAPSVCLPLPRPTLSFLFLSLLSLALPFKLVCESKCHRYLTRG
jgi:hypothetical protein